MDFTKLIKLHLKSSLKVFRELISYESENLKEISICPKISKLLKEARKAISESDVLINDGDNLFKYKHQDGSICKIDLNMKHCSCAWYLDRAVCKHLVGACIKTSTNFPGLVFMPKVFVSRWRRKRPIYMSPVKSKSKSKPKSKPKS